MAYPKFLLLLFLFGLSPTVRAQTKAQDLLAIKKEYQEIAADKTLKKVTLDNDTFLDTPTDGGRELTGYYKKGQLRKIVATTGLSNGRTQIEYYFKDGQLIFVYEVFNAYDYNESKGTFDYTKTSRTFEGRYYFKENHLGDFSTTGHNRFEDDALDPEKILLQEANTYSRLLKAKKK